ncbi:LolA family protein [Pararoseomonas indoligenes]|uniref:Outer membrane lipoprotein carrier protein LolA n=1 Tax=Roseomonas indoligenes TaxID=2820811 RepID=A0A940MQD9_9PROT|nr:outer membrane lipoprotein carrier protein LolA [Pararoseomonas indoligenes]MBP0491569.1 outer membrane lipoprotein carrier protein LolA [Pararoseomonas indoligenes]
MRRRQILPALALLPLAAPALAPKALAQGALSARDRADLQRVEAYLNGITTLRARFIQIAQNGATAQGTALIWRPGRMRFDYDPPEPLLLVANAGQFMHYDKELRQPSIVPVGSTPLGILLRERITLSGDVTVSGLQREGGFLRVTLFRTANASEGRITLVMADNPLELRQWLVVDGQGHTTRVTLSAIETGIRLERATFDFNDPRFMQGPVDNN